MIPEALKTVGLFVVAAVFEVAGAYLVWQWQRSGKSALFALFGLAALFIYGLIQTLQTFSFGRAFAAYAGIFLLVAMLWGWFVDGHMPDRWDVIGAAICLVGSAVIVGMPRS
jgi:small multidrug resistance family-3 protein